MYLTKDSIEPARFVSAKTAPHCGGVDVFFGVIRDYNEGKSVKELFYDCYEPMAEKEIAKVIERAKSETGVHEIRVLHRIGRLRVGEVAVAIMASGAHRQEAFAACRQVIDEIKQDVPIWKKEVYEDSTHDWVVCRHQH